MGVIEIKDQGTKAEFTVVQKLNQGTIRKRGVIPACRRGRVFGALFGSFLGKQKGTSKTIKEIVIEKYIQ